MAEIQQWQSILVQQLDEAHRKLGIIPAAFVPAGGAAGEVLTKSSGADYDMIWAAVGAGSADDTLVWLNL